MGEGSSFSLFVCPHPGVPHLHPIILPLVPCPFRGTTVSGSRSLPGVPQSWTGDTSALVMDGIPLPHPGMRNLPGIAQQMEYLICSGRYASCVHAGILSCFHAVFGLKFPNNRMPHPTLRRWCPTSGKSWIRHRYTFCWIVIVSASSY